MSTVAERCFCGQPSTHVVTDAARGEWEMYRCTRHADEMREVTGWEIRPLRTPTGLAKHTPTGDDR